MKILYLHQHFKDLTESGGTRSLEFAKYLVSAGHEVHLIGAAPNSAKKGARWSTANIAGVKVSRYALDYQNGFGFYRRISCFLRFVCAAVLFLRDKRADIVFATSTPLTIIIPAVFVARRWGVPLVFEVRDLWPEVPIALGILRSRILIFLARRLAKFAYHNSQAIIALSPGMAEGVARFGKLPREIEVIPNCSDLHLFSAISSESPVLSELRVWLGKDKLILYPGTLGYANDCKYILELAVQIKKITSGIKFLLIGEGAQRQWLVELAEEYKLGEETLRFLNPQPKQDMPGYFAMAAAIISTVLDNAALWNNSPNKVFDTFAAGRALIINHEGWLAQLLRESGAGLVLPPKVDQRVAREVIDLLEDGQKLSLAAEASLRLGRERFARCELAKRFAEILGKVAEEHAPKHTDKGVVLKRSLDLILAGMLLLIFSPLLLLIAIGIYCTMGRPVIFVQQRIGLGGKVFSLFKFRSMRSEATETNEVSGDISRITTLGRLLRRTSFDELPQLVNVLRGEMSLVGPRPLLPQYLPRYSAFQRRRHEVKPGMTGLAQVMGRNSLSWEEKFQYDVSYVDNWTIFLDFKILLLTLKKVISGAGLNLESARSAEEFLGSDSN